MRLRRVEDIHSRSQPLAEADVVEYERLVREVTRDLHRQVRPRLVEFGHTVNMPHSIHSNRHSNCREEVVREMSLFLLLLTRIRLRL
jgi:hypothetical protein